MDTDWGELYAGYAGDLDDDWADAGRDLEDES